MIIDPFYIWECGEELKRISTALRLSKEWFSNLPITHDRVWSMTRTMKDHQAGVTDAKLGRLSKWLHFLQHYDDSPKHIAVFRVITEFVALWQEEERRKRMSEAERRRVDPFDPSTPEQDIELSGVYIPDTDVPEFPS